MNTRDAMLPLFQAVSTFADLDPAVLRTIAERCRAKVVAAGQLVFTQGDSCLDLCFLESGRVKFFRVNAEGREQVLKEFDRPGDMFCIASAFGTGKHLVSMAALAETRLRLLDLDTLHRLTREHPSMGLKLVTTASQHMAHLVDLAEGLALKTATERLAKHLYQLALAEGVAKGQDIRLSRDRLNQEQLASLLGTVRVNVSRSLTNLARAGVIGVDREAIRIRDLVALQQISEGK
jgi:CRP/FNR family cyclic AMP-dependent transcriptional regulator